MKHCKDCEPAQENHAVAYISIVLGWMDKPFFFLMEKAGRTEHILGMYHNKKYWLIRLRNIKILDKMITVRRILQNEQNPIGTRSVFFEEFKPGANEICRQVKVGK